MVAELLLSLNFALLSLTLAWEYHRRFVSPTLFAGLWLLIVFVLVPAAWVSGTVDVPTIYSGVVHDKVDDGLVHAVITLVVLSFCTATLATGQGSVSLRTRAPIPALTRVERRAAYLCLGLGILAVVTATALHGGPMAYLAQLGEIRTGRASNLDRLGAVLMRLGYVAYLAILILLIDRFANRRRTGYLVVAMLLIAIMLYGALSGGRFFLFTLLIGVAVGWALSKRRVPWLWIIPGVLLALFLGGVGKALLYENLGFDVGGMDDGFQFYIAQTVDELSFPFLNMVNLMLESWPVRHGIDVLFWYMKYVRFWGFELQEFDNSTYFNTWLLTGEWRSDMPPGLVMFAYLQAGAFGLVLVPAVFVILMRIIERRIISARTALGVAAGSVLYMSFCAKTVFYCDLSSLFEGLVPLAIAVLAFYVLSRITVDRRRLLSEQGTVV